MPVAVLLGAGAGGWASMCIVLRVARPAFDRPSLRRANHRGDDVPTGVGIVLVVPLAFAALVGAASAWAGISGGREATVMAGTGTAMGILGFIDDMWGTGPGGGFAGHLRALLSGRVTTGLVKAIGGLVVGIGSARALGHEGVWTLAAGALIALAANAINLFDVRPGRAAKVWLLAAIGVCATVPPLGAAVGIIAVAGGLGAFVPHDLGERAMLGDAGANLIGAVLGAGLASSLSTAAVASPLVALVALTGASEFMSLGALIDRTRPLRAFDRLGRRGS